MEEQLTQDFSYLEDLSYGIILDNLPSFEKSILSDFLIPLTVTVGVPVDTLLIELNAKLAQYVSLDRLSVRMNNGTVTPANYYGMLFMRSGAGKDKPLVLMDQYLTPAFLKEFIEKRKSYKEKKTAMVRDEAYEKYSSAKAERDKYIESKGPRVLNEEVGSGSIEGLMSAREAFSEAGFGGTFFQTSELGRFITSKSNNSLDFLTFITDIFDFGNHKVKVIKGEKEIHPVKGVPSNMLLFSPLSGIVSGHGRDLLLDFLNQGLARRSFVSYPILTKPELLNTDIQTAYELVMSAEGKAVRKVVPKIYDHIRKVLKVIKTSKIIELSPKAQLLLFKYEYYNKLRASKLNIYEAEGLIADVSNRQWKVMKLAAISAVFNHPDLFVIDEKDIQSAIYQAEIFGNQLSSFYQVKEGLDSDKLFNYLLHKNDWVSTMEIRSLNWVSKNKFTSWFNETIKEVEDIASINGMSLDVERHGVRGFKYRLVKTGEIKSTIDNMFKDQDELLRN